MADNSIIQDVESEIRDLITKYGRSIDNADIDLAAELWSNTADVSFIHPRGHEHGWEVVRTNFYERTMRSILRAQA